MNDYVDDLLAGLDADKSKPRESVDRAVKIQMSSRDNQGTAVIAPFICNPTKKFYVNLPGVREFKMATSMYSNGDTEVWVKVIPKSAFENLTEDQSKLYDEVTGLFDEVYKAYQKVDKNYLKIRYRTYAMIQGVLINHVDKNNKQLDANLGKAVILIFPSKGVIDALASATSAQIVAMSGSREWVPSVFSMSDKGREGAMSITFTKPEKPGYDCNISFVFNSAFSKIIDPQKGFDQSVIDLLDDPVKDWLGWQNGENSKFNEALFKELKNALTVELRAFEATPAQVGEVSNKNGVDPMLGGSPAPTEESGIPDDSDDLPF